MVTVKTRLKESVERNRKVREAMIKLKEELEKAEQETEIEREGTSNETKTSEIY